MKDRKLFWPAVEIPEERELLAAGLASWWYGNQNLQGAPVHVQEVKTVDFTWVNTKGQEVMKAPAPIDRYHSFSVALFGEVEAPVTGAVTFWTRTDDGVRWFFNGKQEINEFHDESPKYYYKTEQVKAGQKYSVLMEYYENDRGAAIAQMGWQYTAANGAKVDQVIPEKYLSYDPSALKTTTDKLDQNIYTVYKPGKPVAGLTNSTFDFGAGKGTVSVQTDAGVQVENPTSKKTQSGNIVLQLSSNADVIGENVHWLQFIRLVRMTPQGQSVPGGNYPREINGRPLFEHFGELYNIDTIKTSSAFYDVSNTAIRTDRTLGIYDLPTVPKAAFTAQFPAYEYQAQAFLIVNGKPVYQVNWSIVYKLVNGQPSGEYKDISGKPVNGLPDYAKGDKLFAGYKSTNRLEPTNEKLEINNPIPPRNR